jgi:hypothetical protein
MPIEINRITCTLYFRSTKNSHLNTSDFTYYSLDAPFDTELIGIGYTSAGISGIEQHCIGLDFVQYKFHLSDLLQIIMDLSVLPE